MNYALLKTGDSLVIKVNSSNSRIIIEKLQYDVSAASITFNSKTFPLASVGEFCDIPVDQGFDLTLTCTTGTLFCRWRQEG